MLANLLKTPGFRRWNPNSDNCSLDNLLDYQSAHMRIDHLLCYLDFLWPDFIQKDGLILRSNAIPPNWNKFKEDALEASWSSRQIEYVINHLHMSDIFLNDPDIDHIDNELLGVIADRIVEIWRIRLNELFPNKQFMIDVNDRNIDPEIYLYQL